VRGHVSEGTCDCGARANVGRVIAGHVNAGACDCRVCDYGA
jgi:hypothetical protein